MDNSKEIFFIQEHSNESFYHGGIGNNDIEKILIQQGSRPIIFPLRYDFSIRAKLVRILFLIKVCFSIPAKSVIIFQYPLYARMHKILLTFLHFRKSIQKICLIADINGIKNGDDEQLRKDQYFFHRYRYFILHNENMKKWLDGIITGNFSAELFFFDFLAQPYEGVRSKTFQLAFAGNLEKSLFLEKADDLLSSKKLSIFVYGPGFNTKMNSQKALVYKKIFAPYDLPQQIEGSFGLVWDGNGSFDQKDSMAHYMPYISHHKLSLYILSGLPIVIYSKAGSASLIERYGIGITINRLEEIEEKIAAITDREYKQMQQNLQPLAQKIMIGGNLTTALDTILKKMK